MARFNGATEDIYPVGLLSDLQQFWGGLRHPHRPAPPIAYVSPWRRLRYRVAIPLRWARQGNWRAVRSYFNGYLAEDERVPMCGHGWTRTRALRSLNRWRRHYNVDLTEV